MKCRVYKVIIDFLVCVFVDRFWWAQWIAGKDDRLVWVKDPSGWPPVRPWPVAWPGRLRTITSTIPAPSSSDDRRRRRRRRSQTFRINFKKTKKQQISNLTCKLALPKTALGRQGAKNGPGVPKLVQVPKTVLGCQNAKNGPRVPKLVLPFN